MAKSANQAPNGLSKSIGSARTAAVLVLGIGLAGLVFGASGCQESRKCEQARLEVHRAWREIYGAATARKLAGVDLTNWTVAESKADTLQSAFATRQVTWDSADHAKADLTALAKSLSTDNEVKMEIFRTSLAEAAAQHDAFRASCK